MITEDDNQNLEQLKGGSMQHPPGKVIHGKHFPIFSQPVSTGMQRTLLNTYTLHDVEPNQPYVTIQERLETFNECNNIQLKTIARRLSEAGFIYSTDGVEEQVMCPFCQMKDVQLDVELLLMHVIKSPTCTFVLLNLGRPLVDELESWGITDLPKVNQEGVEDCSTTSILPADYIYVNDQIQSFYKQDISVPASMLCKICYQKKVAVAFLPCTHTIACFECALKIDQCSVCRNVFNVMLADLYVDTEEKQDDQLSCSASQGSNDDALQKILCRVCCKEERNILFLGCNHIYACVNCARQMEKCPICDIFIDIAIKVFL